MLQISLLYANQVEYFVFALSNGLFSCAMNFTIEWTIREKKCCFPSLWNPLWIIILMLFVSDDDEYYSIFRCVFFSLFWVPMKNMNKKYWLAACSIIVRFFCSLLMSDAVITHSARLSWWNSVAKWKCFRNTHENICAKISKQSTIFMLWCKINTAQTLYSLHHFDLLHIGQCDTENDPKTVKTLIKRLYRMI